MTPVQILHDKIEKAISEYEPNRQPGDVVVILATFSGKETEELNIFIAVNTSIPAISSFADGAISDLIDSMEP